MRRYPWIKLSHKLMLFMKREQRTTGIIRQVLPWIATILFIIGGSTWFKLQHRFVSEEDWSSETWQNSRIRQIMLDHPTFAFNRSQKLPPPHLKTILLWNTWFRFDSAFFFGTGHQPFIDAKCPVSDCYVSNHLYVMPPSEYDAILFFYPMLTDVPFTYSRRSDQVYVFVDEEPPYPLPNRAMLKDFDGFFNLTMTYRLDSDIHWPYGSIESPANGNFRKVNQLKEINYAQGKTKLVAWFVSHCETQSHRENYVENLKKYIDVDVYGRCSEGTGSPKYCWLGDQDSCYDMLDRDYKFYLSFENSFCRDYVTEKFFEILDRRIVPIVYGGFNYSSIAPPGSYIDATRMGARRLAELLQKIDMDDLLYNQFFSWKREGYRIKKKRGDFAPQAFCKLCEQLHRPQRRQIYQNFQDWWGPENNCHQSDFIIPFNFTFKHVNLDPFKPWTSSMTATSSHLERDTL